MTLRDDIKAEALSLGFSLTGITTPAPPTHGPVFLNWLACGHHGGMDYLLNPATVKLRLSPQLLFPPARSILCLGMPYPPPDPSMEIKPGRGRVAAYAWGRDYHLQIAERLTSLLLRLDRIFEDPIPARAFADNGPLLERDLAQRAGLGWIAKNTCLIHPRLGSYFFLAEVLLSLELEPDPPFDADRCGTCQRCIHACPSGCISPDRTMDASRCISFLTIENKGSIPAPLRHMVGNWIFGCDLCQMVCPWNLRALQPAVDPAFSPGVETASPDLVQTLSLSPQQFKSRFHESPILRAKRRGLLRNVCVAMGNQPDPAFLPALGDVLTFDPDPLIRAHAAWAVRQIRTRRAHALLDILRVRETDPIVLNELMD